MTQILAVEPSPIYQAELANIFKANGATYDFLLRADELSEQLASKQPDLVCLNIANSGDIDTLLSELGTLYPSMDVAIFSERPSFTEAARCMRLGASDYLALPVEADALNRCLKLFVDDDNNQRAPAAAPNAAGNHKANAEQLNLQQCGALFGNSAPMRKLYRMIRKASPADMSVLLIGASGVGKELAAETIHNLSQVAAGPFIPVNCGALSPELMESELFGHLRGSFTGADRDHQGYFERANNGTLFLDEITEMPAELQVKLLRVLETNTIQKVGAGQPQAVNVRIVSATNRDPAEAVRDSMLREDIYYRLAQFPIRLPTLKERGEDVVTLAKLFLEHSAQEHGENKQFSAEALDYIDSHPWPGNVRELKHAVERAFLLADTVIEPKDFPPSLDLGSSVLDGDDCVSIELGSSLATAEQKIIEATLEDVDHNKAEAAKLLEISPKTLYNKLSQYK